MKFENIGARLAAIAGILFAFCVPVICAATEPVKNIVLVHGAFADGSSWSKGDRDPAGRGLQRHRGPESADFARRRCCDDKRALALQKGPVILVGH